MNLKLVAMLQERKIPKCKEREEHLRKSSFDDALESLGASERFITLTKEQKEKVESKEESKSLCTEEQ